jgi:prophage regulatory protein
MSRVLSINTSKGFAMESKNQKFLRLPEVISRTGYRRSNIYHLMSLGEFPKAISLGGRAVAWLESEVDEWMESRIRQREASEISAITSTQSFEEEIS